MGAEMSGGYDEETLVRPNDPRWEVYGQDGYDWYTFTDDADDIKREMRRRGFRVTLELSTNPTFTKLRGATRAKLISTGFMS